MTYNLVFSDEVDNLLKNYDDNKYAPSFDKLFYALEITKLKDVNVVILGQDPYPKKGDAMGLSFSVDRSEKLPASLRNIYKELSDDLNVQRVDGNLTDIAKQGVLFLNTVLSVEIGSANSHKNLNWQLTTDSIIKQVSDKGNVIFVLLGKQAQQYENIIDVENNFIIKEVHPSPLSAYRGFFGSKLFSRINKMLVDMDKQPLNWN